MPKLLIARDHRFNTHARIRPSSTMVLVGAYTPVAGGAVFLAGGSPRFTNCLFVGNTAMEGAAIAVDTGTPTFINCTVADNQASVSQGGGIFDPLGLATIQNCIFWGNIAVVGNPEARSYPGLFSKMTKTNIAGGYIGLGNMDSDPLFEVASGNYRLQNLSPCKNAGQTSLLPPDVADLDWDGNTTEKVPFDLNGDPRKVEFVVDMGAYETPVDPGAQ